MSHTLKFIFICYDLLAANHLNQWFFPHPPPAMFPSHWNLPLLHVKHIEQHLQLRFPNGGRCGGPTGRASIWWFGKNQVVSLQIWYWGPNWKNFGSIFFSKVLFILSNIERVCVVSRVWAVITDQGPKTPSFLSIPNCRCIRRTRWRLEHGGIHGTKTNKPSQKKMVFVNKSIEKKPTESQFFGDLF